MTIGVAMSGGVDSSVTAALLKKQGHAVRGYFMALAQPDIARQLVGVRQMAARLGVPLEVVELGREFEKKVLDYFAAAYLAGKTPNPCIICNREIKFGLFMDLILAKGADYMATGHYARIDRPPVGPCRLRKGRDPDKDQSYFLCRLTPRQLARLQLPLGEYTKKQVYGLAADFGLAGLYGKESQDVCFLKDRGVGDFLAERHQALVNENSGPIVTADHQVIGRHRGIHGFTVGQRRGLGLPDAAPYYVIGLRPEGNEVVVGRKQDLYRHRLAVGDVNWLGGEAPALPQNFLVRIRYRHQGAAAMVEAGPAAGRLAVRFREPQLAVTPGQFAVFYQGDQVIGGGEILPDP